MELLAKFPRKYPLLIASLMILGLNIGLVGVRIAHSHRLYYLFLIWNLFLAVIPYLFIRLTHYLPKSRPFSIIGIGLFTLCLLFLPNSPYIITDLFHLRPRHSIPLWYDALMIFSFALTGVLFFFAALKDMYRFLTQYMGNGLSQLCITAIIYLCAFGVYLGRYLRFNSWDILTHPGYLFSQIFDRILFPFDHPKTWAMTLVYGTLLVIGWVLINLFAPYSQSEKAVQ